MWFACRSTASVCAWAAPGFRRPGFARSRLGRSLDPHRRDRPSAARRKCHHAGMRSRLRANPDVRSCEAVRDVSGMVLRHLVWPWMDGRDLGSGGAVAFTQSLPGLRRAFEFPMLRWARPAAPGRRWRKARRAAMPPARAACRSGPTPCGRAQLVCGLRPQTKQTTRKRSSG